MKSKITLRVIVMFALLAGIIFIGCKKIELVRISKVKTGTAIEIDQNSAKMTGSVVDLGDGITDHGFCWSSTILSPTKNDNFTSKGATTVLGDFSSVVLGLNANTDYRYRSYIDDGKEVKYGDVATFKTPGSGGGFWLKYDDGTNFTSIGLTEGANFDYAVRFPVQVLTNYDGYRISKIRFFPNESATFYAEVYEGIHPPVYVFHELINNPVIDSWNEYTPIYNYYIDSDVEVWVGIWVTNYVMGTYPGGVDDGPAIAGAGDMISFDDGSTWESMYLTNSSLNYNWNLEVYVTNQKGVEIKLDNNSFKQNEKVLNTGKKKSATGRLTSEIENH